MIRAIELGADLEYLLDRAQSYELDLIFEGLAKREENAYKRTRLSMFASLAPWGKNLKLEGIFALPSDNNKSKPLKINRAKILEAANKLINDGKSNS